MMAIRRAFVAGLGIVLFLGPTPASASVPTTVEPAQLELGSSEQVVIVTAPNWRSRTGTVTAYQRTGNEPWTLAFGPMKAMLGYSGLTPAKDRRQGTGKTPTGTFRLVTAFGRQPDPGTAMPYQQVDRNDAWTYHPRFPSTYNMLQTANRSWRDYGGYVEHLWSYGVQYDYVAVMDYNLPPGPIRRGADGVRRTARPADTRAGGGIFLHASDGTVTAGCIAIPVAQMRAIMRWLDPARDPRIVVRVARPD